MAIDYQKKIFTLLQEYGKRDTQEIAQYFGVSRQFIERHLKEMLDNGEVKKVQEKRLRIMQCRGLVVRKQNTTMWVLNGNINTLADIMGKKWT